MRTILLMKSMASFYEVIHKAEAAEEAYLPTVIEEVLAIEGISHPDLDAILSAESNEFKMLNISAKLFQLGYSIEILDKQVDVVKGYLIVSPSIQGTSSLVYNVLSDNPLDPGEFLKVLRDSYGVDPSILNEAFKMIELNSVDLTDTSWAITTIGVQGALRALNFRVYPVIATYEEEKDE